MSLASTTINEKGEVINKEGSVVGYATMSPKDFHTPEPLRYPSTLEDLLEFGHDFFIDCLKIAEARNKRYAKANDPFKNFRLHGEFGICVRMGDKIARLATLTEPGNTISDGGESVEDTCRDLANYCMLLSAMRANERGGDGK